MLKLLKLSGSLLLLSTVFSNQPQPLLSQSNKNIKKYDTYYKRVYSSKINYVYSNEGDQIISVNYGHGSKILSKTFYTNNQNSNSYLYIDECKNIECLSFIHQ